MGKMLVVLVFLIAIFSTNAVALAGKGEPNREPVPACDLSKGMASQQNPHCQQVITISPPNAAGACSVIVNTGDLISPTDGQISGSFGTIALSVNDRPYTLDFDYLGGLTTIDPSTYFCGATVSYLRIVDASGHMLFEYTNY